MHANYLESASNRSHLRCDSMPDRSWKSLARRCVICTANLFATSCYLDRSVQLSDQGIFPLH